MLFQSLLRRVAAPYAVRFAGTAPPKSAHRECTKTNQHGATNLSLSLTSIVVSVSTARSVMSSVDVDGLSNRFCNAYFVLLWWYAKARSCRVS